MDSSTWDVFAPDGVWLGTVELVAGREPTGATHRDSDVDVAVVIDRGVMPDRGTRSDLQVRLTADLIAATHRNDVQVVIVNDAPPELAVAAVDGKAALLRRLRSRLPVHAESPRTLLRHRPLVASLSEAEARGNPFVNAVERPTELREQLDHRERLRDGRRPGPRHLRGAHRQHVIRCEGRSSDPRRSPGGREGRWREGSLPPASARPRRTLGDRSRWSPKRTTAARG